MARVALVCSQTPINQFLEPILVAFLVVLRIKNIEIFEKLVAGHTSPDDVMTYVRTFPGGAAFALSHLGTTIETYLLTGDSNEQRKNSKIASLKVVAESPAELPETSRARQLMRAMTHVSSNNFGRYSFNISNVANKVEMASSLSS